MDRHHPNGSRVGAGGEFVQTRKEIERIIVELDVYIADCRSHIADEEELLADLGEMLADEENTLDKDSIREQIESCRRDIEFTRGLIEQYQAFKQRCEVNAYKLQEEDQRLLGMMRANRTNSARNEA